tara:strand:+ start:4972 stop:5520 length:549 start_codon:yes stop_codon:yes gene_type:complete
MEEMEIETFEGVYEPAEDSWMMCNYLPNDLGSVLEIGCGSGIISVNLAKKGNKVTSVDINPKAIKATKHNAQKNNVEIEILQSDMFSAVSNRKFDVIICNPPYLPPSENYNDPELELAVEGGANGHEFTSLLLSNAKNFLNDQGSIFMIQSSKMGKFRTSWNKKIIREERFFFETLSLVHFY